MTEQDRTSDGATPRRDLVQPSRRDRWRPLELLGLSFVFAAFVGIVTLIVMHPWGEFADQAAHGWFITLIAFGGTFVLSLVILAMLSLGGYEPPEEPPSRVLDQEH